MIKSQPIKWHGGKSYLANWIHSLAPPSCVEDSVNGYTHRNIAFAGGLGEFWNWNPIEGISETVNDLNCRLYHFYIVLRCPTMFAQFSRLCNLTLLSEPEFQDAEVRQEYEFIGTEYQSPSVAIAHDFFTRIRQSRQGLGKDYTTPTTRTRRGMNEQVSAWLSAVDGLPECHERLRRVEVRNMDAIKFIKTYDHPRALFYCDPPYLHETRSSTGEYGKNEMSTDGHAELLGALSVINGKFMLSGYPSDLYNYAADYHRWKCHEKEIDNKASSAKKKEKKIECVWTNY